MENYNKDIEVWKDIEGYEGLYQVSNLGNVKSLDRVVPFRNSEMSIKGKMLTKKNVKGYHMAQLCSDGIKVRKSVHRLVAQAFIPNKYNKSEVNHLDENKLNNKVDNLEWATSKENANYGMRNKKISDFVKKNGVVRKNGFITKSKRVSQVDLLSGDVIKVFDSLAEANLSLGKKKSSGNISMCCSGKLKMAYGYQWKYLE